MRLYPALIAALLCCTGAASATAGGQESVPQVVPSASAPAHQAGFARHAMVAAANPLAVAAGLSVLKAGGGAVDAAVAVQAVLGLVEPQSSGLGGGAFLLYYDAKTRRVTAYDGRETAPAGATPTQFLGDDGRPLRLHDLRHAFGSAAFDGGLTLEQVGQLFGHQDPRSTRRYSKARKTTKRRLGELMVSAMAEVLRLDETGNGYSEASGGKATSLTVASGKAPQ